MSLKPEANVDANPDAFLIDHTLVNTPDAYNAGDDSQGVLLALEEFLMSIRFSTATYGGLRNPRTTSN